MKRDDKERRRRFRSYTVNFASAKARTAIITLGVSTAVFAIIICVLAVQLIAGGGQKGLAGKILHSISISSLSGVISQEIPMYASIGPTPTISEGTVHPKGLANMILYLFTDIDAGNPLTVLGYQVPGMAVSEYQLVTPGAEYDVPPAEHEHDEQPNLNAEPREKKEPLPPPKNEPLVYAYHSHNRESFLPVLEGVTDPDKAYHADANIEQSGTWLINALKQNGYPGIQTLEDYWTQGSFNDAYDLSRKTVQNVLNEHKNLQLIFDIHRDANRKDVTTRKINGEDYAAVYWIVGGGNNPHADQNEKLATELNEYMKKMYPGLSRGVWKKNDTRFDTRYNHDLSPKMVLIEVGGPDNTMEEVKRTSEALAKIAEAYLKDKGFAPQTTPLTPAQQNAQQPQ